MSGNHINAVGVAYDDNVVGELFRQKVNVKNRTVGINN